MATPKRRPTDPKVGTMGPKRGDNDAFKQHEAKKGGGGKKDDHEGTLARRRKATLDSVIDTTIKGGKPKPW